MEISGISMKKNYMMFFQAPGSEYAFGYNEAAGDTGN